MILVIDNYDSFVHNLARYLVLLGQQVAVVRNDALTVDDVPSWSPQAIVLSPGPCTPHEAGCCLEIVRRWQSNYPMLGVCLGHQVLGEALGGSIVRSDHPTHGRGSDVFHDGQREFRGVPNPFCAGRYHSLVVDPQRLPDCLERTAWTADDTVMAIRHREWPLVGWQFHPESILTECGFQLLANWLTDIGLQVPDVPSFDRELVRR
ncbi:MAG: aminodeoxychorismate/anthranilate synthase component II [Pirellulales bacterium]